MFMLFDLGLKVVAYPETKFAFINSALVRYVVFMFYKHPQFEQVLDVLVEQGLAISHCLFMIVDGPVDTFKYVFTLAKRDVFNVVDAKPAGTMTWFCDKTIESIMRKVCLLLACGYIPHLYLPYNHIIHFPSTFVIQYIIGILFRESVISRCIEAISIVPPLTDPSSRSSVDQRTESSQAPLPPW